MSVRIMSIIFRANFDKLKLDDQTIRAYTAKYVLTALADCANDEGKSAYPSAKSLAMKTNISTRAVMYALKSLENAGIIHKDGFSEYGTINYSIDIKAIENLEWDKEATQSYDEQPPHVGVGGYASSAEGGMQVMQGRSASSAENSASLADNTSLKPSIKTRAQLSVEEHKAQTRESIRKFEERHAAGEVDFSWLGEGLVPLARAFVRAVGAEYAPTRGERTHWRKVLNDWREIGLTDDIITRTVTKMRQENLNIASPQSITNMARNLMAKSAQGQMDLPPVYHAPADFKSDYKY